MPNQKLLKMKLTETTAVEFSHNMLFLLSSSLFLLEEEEKKMF